MVRLGKERNARKSRHSIASAKQALEPIAVHLATDRPVRRVAALDSYRAHGPLGIQGSKWDQ
jgi:hypothetical protein